MLVALILVTWANAAPVAARLVLPLTPSRPVDGGRLFADGRPLLGRSKTWRGWAVCVVTTPVVASLLGLSWLLGLLVALGAMAGDSAASFVKRRLGLRSSESALGLDQIPESLAPALVLRDALALSSWDVLGVILGFCLIDLLLTPLARR